MRKHAYLIMAHGNFNLLETLLHLLDDKRNDIYIHIDKKVKKIDYSYLGTVCNESEVYFSKKRINVKWGEDSQVKTEMLLFKMASKKQYAYYHLCSGVDLPLKTQNEVHEYFKNDDREYLYFAPECSKWDYQRISIYHFPKSWEPHILALLYGIQNKFKIDRIQKYGMTCCKGFNWCSLTHDAIIYLLQNQKFIFRICRWSVCADEVYKQYILFNSSFKERIYRDSEGKTDDLREVDWSRRVKDSPHIYTEEDYDFLSNSSKLFARKFDEHVDSKIVKKIVQYIEERKKNEKNWNCNSI